MDYKICGGTLWVRVLGKGFSMTKNETGGFFMGRMEKGNRKKMLFFRVLSLLLLTAMLCGEFPQRQAAGAQGMSGDFEIVDGVLVKYHGTGGKVTIPKGVTSIGDWAFNGCSGLKSITIPEGVTSIGDWVFHECSSLTSVTIPKGVTSIEDVAFHGCSALTSITIPKGVTNIGTSAFFGCSALTSVTIPAGVTSIGPGAFESCSALTSITIPKEVTDIGRDAFSECSDNLIIYGKKGSYAEKYAKENRITFQVK